MTFSSVPLTLDERLLLWPCNIRELQNILEQAVILSSGPVLQVPLADLPLCATPARATSHATLAAAERAHILAALEETGWVLGGLHGAAVRLEFKRSTLQFCLRKLRLIRPSP